MVTQFMGFVANLILVFLFHYGEVHSLKSIKMNEKIMYDCVDIYKQPSLSHPLLKNHKIQVKPSNLISDSRNGNSEKDHHSRKRIRCPNGTVPIMKMREEDLIITQQLAGSPDDTHVAEMTSKAATKYRGVEAAMSGHELSIDKSQAVYAQIFVGGGTNGQDNVIQAGWAVFPALFGDGRVWTFGYWKGKGNSGCHNTLCKGFVQVAQDDPLSEPLDVSSPNTDLQISIFQDKQTGNWWINNNVSNVLIAVGYWPKELFDSIDDGATMIGYGGVAQLTPPGPSPPMGNGLLPTVYPRETAYFSSLRIWDNNYNSIRADQFQLDTVVDSKKCYALVYAGYESEKIGVLFMYGGPGGNNCGS